MLHGIIECYYVFDKTAYRTGLNVLKNVQPYPGLSLNFCALQLDNGPVKTSDICFDNSGIDPNHPYVIAKVGRDACLTVGAGVLVLCQGQVQCPCCACPCHVVLERAMHSGRAGESSHHDAGGAAGGDTGAPVQHLSDVLWSFCA